MSRVKFPGGRDPMHESLPHFAPGLVRRFLGSADGKAQVKDSLLQVNIPQSGHSGMESRLESG